MSCSRWSQAPRSTAAWGSATEAIEDIWAELDNLSDDLDGMMDSVGFLLMEDEQSFWPDD